MTSGEIKSAVAAYLRYQRQCLLVAFERGGTIFETPDILAVSDSMRLIEVEVKVSLADFRADAKKRKWHPSYARAMEGRIFYYAVPHTIAQEVAKSARPGAGVMACHGLGTDASNNIRVITRADSRKPKIGMRVFMELARAQTGTLIRLAKDLEDAKATKQQEE